MKTLRLALAQINPTVGDIGGNTKIILSRIAEAKDYGAEVVAFPELSITGYPPEDLLLKPHFIADNLKALDTVREAASGIVAVVGFVDEKDDIYNAAAVISEKTVIDVYHKIYLPNYGVFDEYRYFQAGRRQAVYQIGDVLAGVNICEDIWYPEGPTRVQALMGAELIININASPYTMGKAGFKENMLSTRASDSAVIVAYLNMAGGQDELVFDGGSLVINEKGEVIARGKRFEEDLIVIDLDLDAVFLRRLHDPRRRQQALLLEEGLIKKIPVPMPAAAYRKPVPERKYEAMEPEEEVYSALVLGVSDYMRKNNFKGVLIGLSGGIDSALVTTIAVDALGKDNVSCIFMPSRYTSEESREDSIELAGNLGIRLIEIPIEKVFESYLDALSKEFKGLAPDITEENLQARTRGNILMAFSNKLGLLVLTTGNKSEMSVGYATLYGDMAGGFAVIKDVPKTLVYGLSVWRNRRGAVIPERILTKEPTAELKPGQKDSDTLPAYSVLDPILKAYIEEEKSFEEMLSMGFSAEETKKAIGMVDRSEYKRRQSPPGIKITPRAFGRDRRFPITNKYKNR
ncbi:MAG: NAD+ synthase [Parvibaculum sp.]|uniref:NAD+ synthase n=1 Tax=Parvibaculum sp. TaxID=2024848 RepID=UPI00272F84FF|nr:NAD+ synthase [Parvibaculum sp.]MDP2151607.1 NAD+ synthase [Parvibaculum sp.]